MKHNDHLKDILSNIDHLNESIDLEEVILSAIYQEKILTTKIVHYKQNGLRGTIVAFVIVIILAAVLSHPYSFSTTEESITTYASLMLALMAIYFQLEMGHTQIFTNYKKD